MTPVALLSHSEIEAKYTWNAPSVFESEQAWQAEYEHVLHSLPALAAFQGRLAAGPDTLVALWEALEDLTRRVGRLYVYGVMAHHADTAEQSAARMYDKSQGLFARLMATAAFIDPELLAMGQETLAEWAQAQPRLAIFRHYVDDLFRKQAHVRSAEVEELLGLALDPFRSVQTTFSLLTNADIKFRPARSADGRELPVTQGTYEEILAGADREARRTAWESYTDGYLAFKNTLANNLSTSIKQNVFGMRARRHTSTLEASLFADNIPTTVFHNLIETFRANLPTWRRYWAIRRKALGVETLHPYDIWAPLGGQATRPIPYEQAVEWICAGLARMGEEYVRVVRQGCLQDRWVDAMPNQGKTEGAFSSGWPGTHPFILMSYDHTIFSLSTLAHELGHSLHSYLAWQHQPIVYSQYSLFAAEVASNFHQALVRAYLLEGNADPAFQMRVIEEAMSNFHRYFFIMPTLARFELETHQRVERGEALSADDLIELMADLFSEGYGGEMQVDRQRVGITWATFSHLYSDYYVYQYATGISGAHALASRILSGEPGAADDYLGFLKAGSSVYALEALQRAGVDLTSPRPVEAAFQTLAGLVDRLETLVENR